MLSLKRGLEPSDKFFYDYFHHSPPEDMNDIWPIGTLVVDVFENPQEGYTLLADLPGRAKNEINVQVCNNILKISIIYPINLR